MPKCIIRENGLRVVKLSCSIYKGKWWSCYKHVWLVG